MDTYPHFYDSGIDGKTILVLIIINVVVWRWARAGKR